MISGALMLVGLLAVQQASLQRLQRELASLKASPSSMPAPTPAVVPLTAEPGETIIQRVPMDPEVYERLLSLEESVGQLTQASEYLMDRGTLPLVETKIAELVAQLNDPNARDQDRIRALQRLRRERALDDTGVALALSWLNTSTNSNLRRDILRNLEGLTNAATRAPLLQLAAHDANPDVREQAIDNLGRFTGDPQVQARLLDILNTDDDASVREEAINALRRGPLTDFGIATLRQHAMDSEVALDERLIAMRALSGADEAYPQVIASLAQQAQASQDPNERAKLFAAFEGVNDPVVKVPLVYGLQDPNPLIRERAADALSGFQDDQAVREWLQYVSENDADPRVRREALQALQPDRRRR